MEAFTSAAAPHATPVPLPPREKARPTARTEALIRANERLAPYMVRRFLSRFHVPAAAGLTEDDLIGEAFLALCHAATTWDPARGAFTTYAGSAIHNRLLRACGLERGSLIPQVEWVSLDAPARDSDDERLEEVLLDPRLVHQDPINHTDIALRQAIASLPERDRTVVLALLAGGNPSEVARRCGCSRQRIKQIENRAMHRLRLLMGEPREPAVPLCRREKSPRTPTSRSAS